jgi:hypothetical protein
MLKFTDREREYLAEVKRTVSLGLPLVDQLGTRQKRSKRPLILLAHRVSDGIATKLREAGIAYVDLAGNCHLESPPGIYVHVEGRRLDDRARIGDARANLRSGGLHVLFALVARPELAGQPVRELAAAAGAGKSTTAAVLKRLADDGLIGGTGQRRRVLRPTQLRERWLTSYAQTLRPKWIRGRFRPSARDHAELEAQLASALQGAKWAWGGTAAEQRLIGYYRGAETIVHVAEPMPELPKRIRALPDRQGPLVVMVTPIPLAFEGPEPNLPHPLLVYSELLASSDERAMRAAAELEERLPGWRR